MAEVFIAYQEARSSAAAHLAKILELNGYSVSLGPAHGQGSQAVDHEIGSARAVIVLWCTRAAVEDQLLEKAFRAKELDKLVPVWIERHGLASLAILLPFGFARLDTIDLSGWDGAPRSSSLDRLLLQLAAKLGHEGAANLPALHDYETAWRSSGAPTLESFGPAPPALGTRSRARGRGGRRLLWASGGSVALFGAAMIARAVAGGAIAQDPNGAPSAVAAASAANVVPASESADTEQARALSDRCYMLYKARQLTQARQACEAGLGAIGTAPSVTRGALLFSEGLVDEALGDDAQRRGDATAARAQWARALADYESSMHARTDADGLSKTRSQSAYVLRKCDGACGP